MVHVLFAIIGAFYQNVHIHVCVLVSILHCRFQPTDEEKEMYKNYREDKNKLQNADAFLMKVNMYIYLKHCDVF